VCIGDLPVGPNIVDCPIYTCDPSIEFLGVDVEYLRHCAEAHRFNGALQHMKKGDVVQLITDAAHSVEEFTSERRNEGHYEGRRCGWRDKPAKAGSRRYRRQAGSFVGNQRSHGHPPPAITGGWSQHEYGHAVDPGGATLRLWATELRFKGPARRLNVSWLDAPKPPPATCPKLHRANTRA
jgi:hypothetical protein